MRKQFIRLLLSIVCIIIVEIMIQSVIIVSFNRNLKESWSEEVFDEFAEAIGASVASYESGERSSDGIINILVNKSNERISGIIVRDSNGKFALSLGASPKGVPVPSLSGISEHSQYTQFTHSNMRITANMEVNTQSEVYEIDHPKYELAIKSDAPAFWGASAVKSIAFFETNQKGREEVVYPTSLDKNDVAGTILITYNGVPSAYLDVLVYDVDIYNPTKFILAEFFRCLLITAPIALAVAISMAYFVSKKTGKIIKGIKDSLYNLSRGQYDIQPPDSKIEEYHEISKSINMLGEDLERHSRSRKEWIRNISHDLNTPITSMNLLLDGAMDGFFPIDKSLIENLKKENDTLKERVASVSYYSYLLSPSVNFAMAEESLLNIVDEVLQLGGYDARVEFNPETVISGDYAIMKRAIEEVVKNAIMYRTSDREIIIRCEDGDGSRILKVLNDGKLPNPLPLFFEPWARGDDSRTEGGSGLGLSIVYQAMELHHGSVAISEENGVVSVTLEFPNMR